MTHARKLDERTFHPLQCILVNADSASIARLLASRKSKAFELGRVNLLVGMPGSYVTVSTKVRREVV
ncbi:MAG: hypothetical protein LM580_09475, partial [Thermofilum sp.]|nr:hypothetical protein [Thermofilum sp.]